MCQHPSHSGEDSVSEKRLVIPLWSTPPPPGFPHFTVHPSKANHSRCLPGPTQGRGPHRGLGFPPGRGRSPQPPRRAGAGGLRLGATPRRGAGAGGGPGARLWRTEIGPLAGPAPASGAPARRGKRSCAITEPSRCRVRGGAAPPHRSPRGVQREGGVRPGRVRPRLTAQRARVGAAAVPGPGAPC